MKGDPSNLSLERALTNPRAERHRSRGRRGTILVRVARAGWIEVCDEGVASRSKSVNRCLNCSDRLQQGGRGAGLGLDLVQKIMRLHGGHAEAVDGPSGGACLRMMFPDVRGSRVPGMRAED